MNTFITYIAHMPRHVEAVITLVSIISAVVLGIKFIYLADKTWMFVRDANVMLKAVGLQMAPRPNAEGSHNIVDIETQEVVGKQPIIKTKEWEAAITRWIAHRHYGMGYKDGRASILNKDEA